MNINWLAMIKRFYILVIILLLAGCGGSDSGSEATTPFKAWFPDLRSYTYSEEVYIGGDLSGYKGGKAIGNGSIEIYNSLTDQKITAELLTQQECHDGGYIWLFFFIIYIDDYCLSDEMFAAVVPVDMGINEITAEVLDNLGRVVQSKSYSIERRVPALSYINFGDAELDKPFDPASYYYYLRSCSDAESIWLSPHYDFGLDVIIRVDGNESDSSFLELDTQQIYNDIDILVFPYGKDDVAESVGTLYTLTLLNSSNKGLLGINLSTGILDNIFDPQESEHHATVGYVDSSISVSTTPSDMCATLKINNRYVDHNAFSDPILLGEGLNMIRLDVSNDIETNTNRLMVNRESDAEYLQSDYIKLNYVHDGEEYMGKSIATSGNSVVIGAREYHLPYRQAIYVATLSDEGNWSTQKLLGSSAYSTLYDIDISGDTIAVGISDSNTDAVYIYERTQDGLWNNTQQIPSPEYGHDLALMDNILATSRNVDPSRAVVDIYTKDLDSGEWVFDTSINDLFTAEGSYVSDIALHESTLAILVNYTVYIVNRDESGKWNLTDTLTISGKKIALYDNTLVSSSGDVYTKDISGTWLYTTTLRASNHNSDDGFGDSLAIWEDTIAIGAPDEDSRATGVNNANQGDDYWIGYSGVHSGAVYIFKRDQSMSWQQTEYIKASNTYVNAQFGYAVALSNNMLAIGAPGEASCDTVVNGNQADNECYRRGAAYIYK